jgi:hypothetical protein
MVGESREIPFLIPTYSVLVIFFLIPLLVAVFVASFLISNSNHFLFLPASFTPSRCVPSVCVPLLLLRPKSA